MSIWDDFSDGLEVGERMGSTLRNQRAYRDGGLDGAAEAAGRVGDLEGREQIVTMQRRQRMFEDDLRNNAYERMEKIAPLARGALQRSRQLPPERRAAFFNAPHIRQRFEDFGISAAQYDAAVAGLSGPDAERWFAELDAGFSQYTNPDWQLVGNQVIGVDQESGGVSLGGRVPDNLGAGGRYATADEIAQAGYRPGSVVWIAPGEPPRVVQAPSAARPSAGAGYYPDDGYDYESD